jgi:CheY-like chemotaxis protein
MKPESTQDTEESWGSCRGARILVVDDDPDMRALLASRLEKVGCIAREAASGVEAHGILASRDPAHCVDQLPPAILMTAFADPEVRAEALSLGIHILDKPFRFDALRRVATALILSSRERNRHEADPLDPARGFRTRGHR